MFWPIKGGLFFFEAPQPPGFLLAPFLVSWWRLLGVLVLDVLRVPIAMKLMDRCSPCKLHGEVRCLEGMRHFFPLGTPIGGIHRWARCMGCFFTYKLPPKLSKCIGKYAIRWAFGIPIEYTQSLFSCLLSDPNFPLKKTPRLLVLHGLPIYGFLRLVDPFMACHQHRRRGWWMMTCCRVLGGGGYIHVDVFGMYIFNIYIYIYMLTKKYTFCLYHSKFL